MTGSLKNKKVLIIDDEQGMLDIVKAVLKREGASPTGISGAQNGLRVAKSAPFDAIILDRHMPDGDGLEVLKELKSYSKTKSTPIIMLTGEKNMSEISKSIKMGASGYIVKPFKPVDFLKQLHKLLDQVFI